jgi:surface antigen
MYATKIGPALVSAVLFLVSGCANGPVNPDQIGQKEADGQAVGSILGGTIGNFLPGGGSVASQVIKSNAGTIGTLIGGAIGAALDEEDRRKLDEATRRALNSGAAATFANERTGVRATVTPTAATRAADGKQCKTAKQDVVLANGKVLTETVKACKGADGGWEV